MIVVIACDSFKGTMSSRVAGDAIAAGVVGAVPHAQVRVLAVADGGEGTVDAFQFALGGRLRAQRVCGPLGAPIDAPWLIADDGQRAVLEMASASGITHVPHHQRDPMRATTFGTGALIAAAIDAGCREVWIGAGGSATVDGGCGALQALGVRFLARDGSTLPDGIGGEALSRIAGVEGDNIGRAVRAAQITVLCDVDNPLTGAVGAAEVFAPQKGASGEQVARLAGNLEHLADCLRRCGFEDIGALPRAGAAGGLAGGLYAVLGAQLVSGAECVLDAVRFDAVIQGADLVITGEGRFDAQSLRGKLVGAVARRTQAAGVPLLAIVGCEETEHAGQVPPAGISRVVSVYETILRKLPDAATAARDLAETARREMDHWPVNMP